MKLRPCICGGKPKIYGIKEAELRYVYCPDCGKETMVWYDGNKAAVQWNRLMKEAKMKEVR